MKCSDSYGKFHAVVFEEVDPSMIGFMAAKATVHLFEGNTIIQFLDAI